MPSKDSPGRAQRLVAQRLEALERAGVTHVPKARRRATVAPPAADGPPAVVQPPTTQPTIAQPTREKTLAAP